MVNKSAWASLWLKEITKVQINNRFVRSGLINLITPLTQKVITKRLVQKFREQTDGKIDGFVCASGTGGTIGGVSKFLKEKNKDIKIYLSDPTGSALYNHIMNGELKAEGGSITEGIGSSRITKNFAEAKIDGAFSISDQESLPILYDLIQNEGLSLGTSCGVNIAGAIRLGKELGPGKTIVTILCDRSDKYNSKMFNKSFLQAKSLPIPSWL
jgi:Cysteine synthase